MSDPTPLTNVHKPIFAVGIDGSEGSRNALDWAREAAIICGAELDLIRAWQYPFIDLLPASGWTAPAIAEEMRATIEAEMAQLAAETERHGPRATARLATGATAEALLDASSTDDLLVVGNRGLGGLGRFALGSVSNRVATHSTVPVVIVPQDCATRGLDQIVVAVDGSPNSIAALRWADAFAPDDADIVAVRVWEPYDETYAELGTTIVSAMRATARTNFEQAVQAVADEIGRPHRFDTVFDLGRPGVRLVELGHETSLLVLGDRGRSGIRAALLGSVTTWVIHHTSCPTAVVPHP
jgi:nucleotide-binding universal stress UspA family protein